MTTSWPLRGDWRSWSPSKNPADVAALGATLASRRNGRERAAGAGPEDRREHVDPALRAPRGDRARSRNTCTAASIGVLVDIRRRRRRSSARTSRCTSPARQRSRSQSTRPGAVARSSSANATIAAAQAAESGKPAEIVAKMVEGAVNKFLSEVTLLGQPFVKERQADGRASCSSRAARPCTASSCTSSAKASSKKRMTSPPRWRQWRRRPDPEGDQAQGSI